MKNSKDEIRCTFWIDDDYVAAALRTFDDGSQQRFYTLYLEGSRFEFGVDAFQALFDRMQRALSVALRPEVPEGDLKPGALALLLELGLDRTLYYEVAESRPFVIEDGEELERDALAFLDLLGMGLIAVSATVDADGIVQYRISNKGHAALVKLCPDEQSVDWHRLGGTWTQDTGITEAELSALRKLIRGRLIFAEPSLPDSLCSKGLIEVVSGLGTFHYVITDKGRAALEALAPAEAESELLPGDLAILRGLDEPGEALLRVGDGPGFVWESNGNLAPYTQDTLHALWQRDLVVFSPTVPVHPSDYKLRFYLSDKGRALVAQRAG